MPKKKPLGPVVQAVNAKWPGVPMSIAHSPMHKDKHMLNVQLQYADVAVAIIDPVKVGAEVLLGRHVRLGSWSAPVGAIAGRGFLRPREG